MRLYSAEGAGLQQDKVAARIHTLEYLVNDLTKRTKVLRAHPKGKFRAWHSWLQRTLPLPSQVLASITKLSRSPLITICGENRRAAQYVAI